MGIFYWLGIFSSDYINGFSDGLLVSTIISGVYCLLRFRKDRRLRRLRKRYIFAPDGTVRNTDENDQNKYCPQCFWKGELLLLGRNSFCNGCGYKAPQPPPAAPPGRGIYQPLK